MRKFIFIVALLVSLLTACSTPTPTPIREATPAPFATIVLSNGYRPLQQGDVVEGQMISYQYVFPSVDKPAGVIAFGNNLLQLANLKPSLVNGLADYAYALTQNPFTTWAYDENDPNQKEPKQLKFEGGKPIEIAFIALPNDARNWSVREIGGGEMQAAYKIIRRKDGGLRFVDAYGLAALVSARNTQTLNGGGVGLVFSARIAFLRAILSDPIYQRGDNPTSLKPPQLNQYDARILKINPQGSGILQNEDWVIVTISIPVPGRTAE